MSLTVLDAYTQTAEGEEQLFQIMPWKTLQYDVQYAASILRWTGGDAYRDGFFVIPQCCQSSLLDFYNMTELPTQHRQDDGCPVHGWKEGKSVSRASEESLPLAGRRCIHGEYPTPDGLGCQGGDVRAMDSTLERFSRNDACF